MGLGKKSRKNDGTAEKNAIPNCPFSQENINPAGLNPDRAIGRGVTRGSVLSRADPAACPGHGLVVQVASVGTRMIWMRMALSV